jgi:molybdopterin-biosynthesis enzyme MoeA-like protein
MPSAEIVVIADSGNSQKAASGLYGRVREIGLEVDRVGTVADEALALAAEVRGALQRSPDVLLLVGGTPDHVAEAIAAAADRERRGTATGGATPLDAGGEAMLVARTYIVALPGDPGMLELAWTRELVDGLAEWVGKPAHVRGELVILDAPAAVVEGLLGSLADQHPEVYLKAEPANPGQGVRVNALACGGSEGTETAVNIALSAVERAAVASRLRISSTGRTPAHRVDFDGAYHRRGS